MPLQEVTYYPCYWGGLWQGYQYPYGWRIGCGNGGFICTSGDAGDLYFARKVDCELAIKSLVDNGVTTFDKIDDITDQRLMEVVTQYLQW